MTTSIGQRVLYRTEDGKQVLPAIIVRLWSPTCVNLKVFTDGAHNQWVTSVEYGEGPRSWSRLETEEQ